MSCIRNSVLSPGQPDVLLAELDGEGGRVDVDVPPTLLRPLDCDHIVGSGQEVVVRFDQSWTRVGDEVEAGDVEQDSSEHDGAPLMTELSAGELLHLVYSGTKSAMFILFSGKTGWRQQSALGEAWQLTDRRCEEEITSSDCGPDCEEDTTSSGQDFSLSALRLISFLPGSWDEERLPDIWKHVCKKAHLGESTNFSST